MIETMTLTAALAMGFMASGHCVGMCGPLAALGVAADSQQRVRRATIYNVARLVSYASMGALFGGLGDWFGSAMHIAQWSGVLRIGLGVVMLVIGARLLLQRQGQSGFEKAGALLWRRIAPFARRLDPANRTRDLAILGLMWGYLPCGMVYSMLAVAALSGGALTGSGTMFAFGIGTLPAMLGLSLAGSRVSTLRTGKARRGLGAVLVLSGLWVAAMPTNQMLNSFQEAPSGHSHHAMHH